MSPPTTAPADQEPTWSAGAVARMLDVPASTLRGWHRRYQLPLARPQTGRHRRYTGTDIEALQRMRQLIAAGVTAESAAHHAFHGDRPLTTGVADLLAAVERLDTETALTMLREHLSDRGVVETWTDLCCPALRRLGGPEATDIDGCVDLVHLLSWTITAALHRLPVAPTATGRTVLLACVPGERHTLPMEALRAAAGEHAVRVRFLGPSVPASAVVEAMSRTERPPIALVLWSSILAELDPTVRRGDTRLMLAGPGWDDVSVPGDVQRPRSLREAVDFLRTVAH